MTNPENLRLTTIPKKQNDNPSIITQTTTDLTLEPTTNWKDKLDIIIKENLKRCLKR